jgi:hypothetical protein
MISRRALALAALVAARPAAASIPAVDAGTEALAGRMRAGGLVLSIRHACAHRADRDSGIVAIREGQRTITAVGVAQAWQLATPPPAGLNTVLVGHRAPLEHDTATLLPDTTMPEGAIAAILPLGEGGFRWLGSVTTEPLAEIAGV